MRKSILVAVLVLGLVTLVGGTTYLTPQASQQSRLIEEHVYGGMPSPGTPHILVRNAYVISYNCERRVPNWVAYHVTSDYLNTPDRNIYRFKKFRDDPQLDCEAADEEYAHSGYDRGHLVPYAVSGGDRDHDGLYALVDPDDAETVYQVNYMSNIAPQVDSFNRWGLWRKLEQCVQDELVASRGLEVWVIAGTIFGPGEVEEMGPDGDIEVPPMFYKMVILKPSNGDSPKVLAFLFPHQRESHGDIEDFLVSIDTIEDLSGFDFFSAPDDGIDDELEREDTWIFWQEITGDDC